MFDTPPPPHAPVNDDSVEEKRVSALRLRTASSSASQGAGAGADAGPGAAVARLLVFSGGELSALFKLGAAVAALSAGAVRGEAQRALLAVELDDARAQAGARGARIAELEAELETVSAAVDSLRDAAVGYRAAVAKAAELEAALEDLRKRHAVLSRCSNLGVDAAVQATAGAELQAGAADGPSAASAADGLSTSSAADAVAPSSSAAGRPAKRPRPSPLFDAAVAVDAAELARLRAKNAELGRELDDALFANEILLEQARRD